MAKKEKEKFSITVAIGNEKHSWKTKEEPKPDENGVFHFKAKVDEEGKQQKVTREFKFYPGGILVKYLRND